MTPTRMRLVMDAWKNLNVTDFTYPDRMTRAEATKIWDFARKNPGIVKASTDRRNEFHDHVRFEAEVLRYAMYDHPQMNGAPAPWPVRTAKSAVFGNRFGELHPEEAADRLAFAKSLPEFRKAWLDPSHPEHAEVTAQIAEISRVIGAADDRPSAAERAASAAVQAEIAGAMADPAYTNKFAAGHHAQVELVTGLHERAYPSPSLPKAPPVAFAPDTPRQYGQAPHGQAALTPQARIEQLQRDPAYLEKHHPQHAAAVANMQSAYLDRYPPAGPGPTSEAPA